MSWPDAGRPEVSAVVICVDGSLVLQRASIFRSIGRVVRRPLGRQLPNARFHSLSPVVAPWWLFPRLGPLDPAAHREGRQTRLRHAAEQGRLPHPAPPRRGEFYRECDRSSSPGSAPRAKGAALRRHLGFLLGSSVAAFGS